MQKFFLRHGKGGQCPNSNFSKFVEMELSEMSGARKLLLGLQVNMDKNII